MAKCLKATDWKYKEMALKHIAKSMEKLLQSSDSNHGLDKMVEACIAAVGATIREKVIKVFSAALILFNMLVSSSKVDQEKRAMDAL